MARVLSMADLDRYEHIELKAVVTICLVLLGAGCVGQYHLEYLPFRTPAPRTTRPELLPGPPARTYREIGLFESYARTDGKEDAMRAEMIVRAGELGCDALVEVPTPKTASAPRTTCPDPPPLLRAVCIQWLP